MPRIRRHALTAPYVHVVNRSVRQAPLFVRRTDYRAFLAVLDDGLRRYPVRLLAYAVLSNHWHMVLEPGGTKTLIDFMHWVSTTHAVRWHRQHRSVGGGPVYQGRYHCTAIESADVLLRVCRYVERNALAARLVRRAEDWPWCSLAQRRAGLEAPPLRTTPFLSSAAWLDHVNAPTEAERLAEEADAAGRQARRLGRRRGRRQPGNERPGTKGTETVENRSDPYVTTPRRQAGSPAA